VCSCSSSSIMADFLLLPSELAVGKQKLIYALAKNTTKELLRILQSNSVVSVPVWDDQEKRWIGLIDMLDIVAAHNMLDWSATTVDLQELFKTFGTSSMMAREIISKSPRTTKHLIIVCSGEPLINSMQYLTENHKILIGPQNGTDPKAFYLLSQMDIVRQLAKVDLGPHAKRKIEELIHQKNICSVTENDIAKDAFETMHNNHLRALAVVDSKGILTANISISDLKALDGDNIGNIMLKVKAFLTSAHGEKPAVPIVCKPMDNLEQILPKILIAKVHRVWLTNSAEEPIGVVSLTDIIKLLTTEAPAPLTAM